MTRAARRVPRAIVALLLAGAACTSARPRGGSPPQADLSRLAQVTAQFLQDPRRVMPQLGQNQDFMSPVPLEMPLPRYPQDDRARTSDPVIVVVRIVVGEEGLVREVLESPLAGADGPDIDASFRAAVDEAVRDWRFVPASIRTLEDGEDLDHDSKPDYTVLVESTRVPAYLDVRFRFEIIDGEGRVRIDPGA